MGGPALGDARRVHLLNLGMAGAMVARLRKGPEAARAGVSRSLGAAGRAGAAIVRHTARSRDAVARAPIDGRWQRRFR